MPTEQINLIRFSVVSSRAFDTIVAEVDDAVGHPKMTGSGTEMDSSDTYAKLETVIRAVVGTSDPMEFIRFHLGEITRKKHGPEAPRSVRLVVGNPLIMEQMVELAPDAISYAPVTILIGERSDGVHVSDEKVVSALSSCGSEAALSVARTLDLAIESLITAVGKPLLFMRLRQ